MPNVAYTQLSVSEFVDNFTGRRGMPGFDDMKRYKIAECNRDFVWSPALREGFVRSMLNGEPLPALVLCNNELIDGGNRATTMWMYHNNKFKVDEMKYEDLTYEQQAVWRQCTMPVTMIEGATNDEKADYYEKFNQGIVLTFGQKLENRKNRPVVAASFSLIGHPAFNVSPLQHLIRKVWSSRIGNSKARSEVTFAYKIITASILGSAYMYPTWATASVYVAETDDVDLDHLSEILTFLCNVDPDGHVDPKRKKLCFEKFVGAVIHDSWMRRDHHLLTQQQLVQKWQRLFRDAYDVLTPHHIKALCSYKPVGVAAGSHNRIEAISQNVSAYLAGTFRFNVNIEEDEED
jgi:hypothetical protein